MRSRGRAEKELQELLDQGATANQEEIDSCNKDLDRLKTEIESHESQRDQILEAIEQVTNTAPSTPVAGTGAAHAGQPTATTAAPVTSSNISGTGGSNTGGSSNVRSTRASSNPPRVSFTPSYSGGGSSSNTKRIDAKKPTMGGLIEGYYGKEAWVGGKPNSYWTNLENPYAIDFPQPSQMRSSSAKAAASHLKRTE